MATHNLHWFSLNETASFPLDETATLADDTGVLLPNNILVDAKLRWPVAMGRYAYVGSVHISPAIVTITFLVSQDPDSSATAQPLATIAVHKPVTAGRSYALSPQAPGVAGFVVFGSGVDDMASFTAKFSLAKQTRLTARAARPYQAALVPGMSVLGAAQPLTGLVRLRGEGPIEVVSGYRELYGESGPAYKCAVLRLRDTSIENARSDTGGTPPPSTYQEFAGPCGGRPSTGTCEKTPIEFINGVGPDCNGMITVQFTGYVSVGIPTDRPGIVLSSPIGLPDSCQPEPIANSIGLLPSEKEEPIPPTVPPPLCESLSTYTYFEGVGNTAGLPVNIPLESLLHFAGGYVWVMHGGRLVGRTDSTWNTHPTMVLAPSAVHAIYREFSTTFSVIYQSGVDDTLFPAGAMGVHLLANFSRERVKNCGDRFRNFYAGVDFSVSNGFATALSIGRMHMSARGIVGPMPVQWPDPTPLVPPMYRQVLSRSKLDHGNIGVPNLIAYTTLLKLSLKILPGPSFNDVLLTAKLSYVSVNGTPTNGTLMSTSTVVRDFRPSAGYFGLFVTTTDAYARYSAHFAELRNEVANA